MSSHGALPSRAAIVATAQESIAGGSLSFAAASRLFRLDMRERAWLLYAWCRRCDDLADAQYLGHAASSEADAAERLALIREGTEAVLSGKRIGDPGFDALGVLNAELPLPRQLIDDVIAGFALDAEDWRPRSEADLLRYCYHVAGAVGCLMALVMGVDAEDEATLDRACDLGIGFQLANIARDVEADDRVGRCYLPLEWLCEMDIPPGQHMKPPFRSRLAVLVRRLAERAQAYEASGRAGTPKLPFRAAWAVLAAAGIYGAIGRKVAAAGEHAWDHRVRTGTLEKIGWILRAGGEAGVRQRLYGQQLRDSDLWTRPRQPVAARPVTP